MQGSSLASSTDTLEPPAFEVHSDLPAAKPRHPRAPPGVPVEMKYGEAHYAELSVPDEYTLADDLGRKCRYVLVFLVYNQRGERLQKLKQVGLYNSKNQPLTMYGQLIPIAALTNEDKVAQVKAMLRNKRKRDYNAMGRLAPYPVFASLEELVFEYGRSPHHCPAMWLKSKAGVYYRLEEPAGRYQKLFNEEKRKFDVSTRFLKTLQLRPMCHIEELISLLLYGVRDPDLAPSIVKAHQVFWSFPEALTMDNYEEFLSRQGPIIDESSNTPGRDFALACAHLATSRAATRAAEPQELTPWGEQYRLFPPLSRELLISQCGQFVLEQAVIYGRNCGGEGLFSKLPAILQLAAQIRAATENVREDSPVPYHGLAPDPLPADDNPNRHPMLRSHMICAMNNGSFDRYWMRTALHVFDPKPILDYWQRPPAMRRPFFQGYDWLWPPFVVTGKPPPADNLDVEQDIQPLPLQPDIVMNTPMPDLPIPDDDDDDDDNDNANSKNSEPTGGSRAYIAATSGSEDV